MLGKLARWLRILGYDTLFDPAVDDGQAVSICLAEERVLLTRDRALLKRKKKPQALFVESTDPKRQILQVLRDLKLDIEPAHFFRRCLVCNTETSPAGRDEVKMAVPPYVIATQEQFSRCPGCGRIYWKATHQKKMMSKLDEILKMYKQNS
jgi:hypothetical protein